MRVYSLSKEKSSVASKALSTSLPDGYSTGRMNWTGFRMMTCRVHLSVHRRRPRISTNILVMFVSCPNHGIFIKPTNTATLRIGALLL